MKVYPLSNQSILIYNSTTYLYSNLVSFLSLPLKQQLGLQPILQLELCEKENHNSFHKYYLENLKFHLQILFHFNLKTWFPANWTLVKINTLSLVLTFHSRKWKKLLTLYANTYLFIQYFDTSLNVYFTANNKWK